MPSYKLVYFDARGVVETTRLMFAASKTPFEDFRYPLTFGVPGDFSTMKRDEFDAAKANGELVASMGLLPALEIDGTVRVGQSKPIERFVAKQSGLMGSNDIEAFQIDAMVQNIQDFKDAYQKVRAISDADEKKAAMEKWFSEDFPAKVALAEKTVPAGKGPWLIGSKVSYADIAWFQFVAAPQGFYDNTEGAKAAYASCTRIKAAMEAVGALPEIQEWLAKRPDTPV